MATPAASPPASISFSCSDMDELFIAFDKLTRGSPLPGNVIDYVNPYVYEPQNLPDAIWFLISSKENVDMERGFWKTKEEACEVFSDSEIIGWRKTLEYYDGQVPHQHKTDWMMQVFTITLNMLSDDNEKRETSSLCRVYLVPSDEMQQKVSTAGVDNETRNHLTPPPDLDANSGTKIGSSSKPEMLKSPLELPNHRQGEHASRAEASAVAERLPALEHQIDFFEDILQLRDLDNPTSPLSSSENSSAMSISSNECFDSMAFLQELEDQGLDQNDAGKKLDVFAANKPDEVVIVPATLESLVSVEGNNSNSDAFFETAGFAHVSASGSNLNNKVTKRAKVDQRGEGPSSSRKPSAPSDSQTAAAAGGRKGGAAFGGMKKFINKCLCCMPF